MAGLRWYKQISGRAGVESDEDGEKKLDRWKDWDPSIFI